MANMAMHVTGNLTGEINYREASGGKDAMASFAVAWNKGKDRDNNEIPAVYLDLTVFGQDAENLKASGAGKGTRVIAIIEPRPYETPMMVQNQQTGQIEEKKVRRTGYRVLEIGVSVKFQRVSGIAKVAYQGGGAGAGGGDFANSFDQGQQGAPAQGFQGAPQGAPAQGFQDAPAQGFQGAPQGAPAQGFQGAPAQAPQTQQQFAQAGYAQGAPAAQAPVQGAPAGYPEDQF